MQWCVTILVRNVNDDFRRGAEEIAQLGVTHGASIVKWGLAFVVLSIHFCIEVQKSLDYVLVA
jgi:hypothetical protein